MNTTLDYLPTSSRKSERSTVAAKRGPLRKALSALGILLCGQWLVPCFAQSPRLYDDFESGTLQNWKFVGNPTTKVIKLGSGNRVAMFRLNSATDPEPSSSLIARSGKGQLKMNIDYLVSFKANLVQFPTSSSEDIIFDIVPSANPSATGPINLSTQNGKLRLKVRGKVIYSAPYTEKVWTDIEMNVKLSAGQQGRIELVRNGRTVATFAGPNVSANATHDISLGIARPGAVSGAQRVLYVDDVLLFP